MRIECCLGCGRTLEVDEKDPDFFDKVQEQGWERWSFGVTNVKTMEMSKRMPLLKL